MESILFYVSLALCEKFPAFTPFAVYRESFHDVMCLFEDLKQEQDIAALRKANGGKSPPAGSFVHGNTLYVPAQNDDWF